MKRTRQTFGRLYQIATLADGGVALLLDGGQLIIRRHDIHSSAVWQPKDKVVPLVNSGPGPFHFMNTDDFADVAQYVPDSIGVRSLAF